MFFDMIGKTVSGRTVIAGIAAPDAPEKQQAIPANKVIGFKSSCSARAAQVFQCLNVD